ncbi:hypothetical protein KI387_024174, partial [Taxus chinensis]
DSGATFMCLQLKPRLENNKYVENEFMLPPPPKGKHTMENVPDQKPTVTIQIDEEEEKHEYSRGLDHRGQRKPIEKVE